MTWQLTPLKEITTKIGSGATPRGGKNSYKTEGITLIRSLNVYDFEFSYEGLAFITEGQASETRLSRVIVEPQDILLNITGASVARCCMVPEHLLPARVNQHVSLVRVDSNRVDSHYVLYCINSPVYKHQLLVLAQGGTTREALTKEIIGNFEIPLPPLPTQRKIAAILSTYDDLIENNTRRIKILEEMASAIYREWFIEFRFPGHEGVEMVEAELDSIPQGWEVKRLADLVETQYGYTASATEAEVGPKFVRGKDMNKNSYIDWDTVPFCPIEAEKYMKYQLYTDDILVIRMADPGKVAIIEKEIDAVFASYLIRLKLRSNHLSPYYLFYTLLDERYQDYVYGVSTGTTRKSASAEVITGFDLVVPTDEIRDRFEGVIASLRKALNNLLEKNTNLRQTRDLLLPKLISGEIGVSDLKIKISV